MKNTLMLSVAVMLMLSVSCAHEYTRPDAGEAAFRPVTSKEAVDLINGLPDLQIVDTRTGWERSGGWIANSVHVSYFTFLFGGGYDRLDRNSPVLLICAHGVRSYRVGRSLISRGWREVYDLEGGMKQWLKDGYPVVTEKQ